MPLSEDKIMDFILSNLDIACWIFAIIVFGVTEAMTVSVVSIWFVIGSICALIAAFIGIPLWIQALIFAGTSFGLLATLRKSFNKEKQRTALPSERDRLKGQIGIVSAAITPAESGQVYINNLYWSARALDPDSTIEENTKIIVCDIEGIYCIVEKYELD